jgi:hypothetical protein
LLSSPHSVYGNAAQHTIETIKESACNILLLMMGVSATANKRQEPPSSETTEAEEISSGTKVDTL